MNPKAIIKRVVTFFAPYGIPYGLISILWNLIFKSKYIKNKLKPRNLLSFEMHLADHCNLNCVCCNHFSPIAKEKYLNPETFRKDCDRISKLSNRKIGNILLLGGEPLLHPQITSIFDIINLNFDSYTAAVVTNGILLNKQSPIFWESCRKNAIEIIITKYPINLNFDFLKDIAEKYGVKIKFWGNTETTIQTMQRVPLDLKGKQNYVRSFKICSISNGCITLKEGKLFTCSLVPHINHFNEYFNQNLQVTKDDYIDIDKAKNIKEILEFLSKPIPFCRYCNIMKKTGFIKWSISKKDIKEWT